MSSVCALQQQGIYSGSYSLLNNYRIFNGINEQVGDRPLITGQGIWVRTRNLGSLLLGGLTPTSSAITAVPECP